MSIIIGCGRTIIVFYHHGCDIMVNDAGIEIQCAIDTEFERCTDGQHDRAAIGCFSRCQQITEFVIGQRSDGDGIDGAVVGDGEVVRCGIAAFIDGSLAIFDQSDQRFNINTIVRAIICIINSFSNIEIIFKTTGYRSGIGIRANTCNTCGFVNPSFI